MADLLIFTVIMFLAMFLLMCIQRWDFDREIKKQERITKAFLAMIRGHQEQINKAYRNITILDKAILNNMKRMTELETAHGEINDYYRAIQKGMMN